MNAASSVLRSSVLWGRYLPVQVSRTSCFFHTRAHPKPHRVFPVPFAVDYLLNDYVTRSKRKVANEERLQKIVALKKCKPRKPRNKCDETVELAVNLNLDPRKPGQALRGSLSLPHGTGKKGQSVIVFTKDEAMRDRATEAGALHTGAENLVDDVVAGRVPIDSFQVALASPEMIPVLTKAGAARILGPRGLMPNKKVGTVVESVDGMLEQLETYQAAKQVTYRTEKEGIIHVPVGKVSFGKEKILDNIGEVMKAIFDVKPEAYGKGKKRKKASKQQPQYLLKASVCATQGKGFRIDIRSMDPGGTFFLQDVDPLKLAGAPLEENAAAANEPEATASKISESSPTEENAAAANKPETTPKMTEPSTV